MKIDWKRIHEEFGPEYKWAAWDEDGSLFVFSQRPTLLHHTWAVSAGGYKCVTYSPRSHPDWKQSLVEFKGYDSEEMYLGSLRDLSASLHEKASEGKEAAKRAKKVDHAIEVIDSFLKQNGKALESAGIEVIFKVKE